MLPEAPKNKSLYEEAVEAFSFLKERLPETLQHPRVAVICGSGLGGLANTIHDEPRAEFEYSSIPHFPCLTGKNEALKLNINLLISDLWSAGMRESSSLDYLPTISQLFSWWAVHSESS